MKKLIYLFLALLIVACSDDNNNDGNNNNNNPSGFLEKYNNVLFDISDDDFADQLGFSDGRIRLYNDSLCSPFINTEGPTYLSENFWLWEYGSGTFNSSIVENTADKLVLQLEVSEEDLDYCNTSWYNTWTFTISGNSLTFESEELTWCDPDEFITITYNYSKTTEDLPDC
jgi:hypothetical protein